MKRLYLIEQYDGTFGQTDAGCHSSTGPEKIIASAPLTWGDDTALWAERKAEQLAFLAKAKLVLHFGRHEFRLPGLNVDEFFDVVALLETRKGSGPWVSPSFGPWAIRIMDEVALAPASVQIDAANLAYQRELLGRA